ncbi:unnamed protein product [Rotaria socialis]
MNEYCPEFRVHCSSKDLGCSSFRQKNELINHTNECSFEDLRPTIDFLHKKIRNQSSYIEQFLQQAKQEKIQLEEQLVKERIQLEEYIKLQKSQHELVINEFEEQNTQFQLICKENQSRNNQITFFSDQITLLEE